MSKDNPIEVALFTPSDTAAPANAPTALHQVITGDVTATDIETAWRGGCEIGWVYRGSE